MTRQEAIARVNAHMGAIALNKDNTRFSNINSAAEVWWLTIPQTKFSQDLHFILNNKNSFIWLKLPEKTFENLSAVFKIRSNGEVDLEISSLRESYMIDTRSGGTRYNFRRHIEREFSK